MNWTAENDRLFFLKVIEIHGISPNYQKIQEAWRKCTRPAIVRHASLR